VDAFGKTHGPSTATARRISPAVSSAQIDSDGSTLVPLETVASTEEAAPPITFHFSPFTVRSGRPEIIRQPLSNPVGVLGVDVLVHYAVEFS
jgi:hypothetical protein